MPLKILANFEPEQSFVLEPGDMLYLPPRYAHDGVAVGGDCMTYSIGLRSPAAAPLGADLLARIAEAQADALQDAGGEPPCTTAIRRSRRVDTPAAMPRGAAGLCARGGAGRAARSATPSTARWANR